LAKKKSFFVAGDFSYDHIMLLRAVFAALYFAVFAVFFRRRKKCAEKLKNA
jgi:hypothetical protein